MRGTKPAPKQSSIFDQRERLKQEGIEVSYRNANSPWKKEATARVMWLANNCQEFTSDDVIEYLEAKGITTGNNSALGAIMQAAARMGIIQPTEYYKDSRRPKRHMAPVKIWRSNLFNKGGEQQNGN